MTWLGENYRDEGLGLVEELEEALLALLALQEQPAAEEEIENACRALRDLRNSAAVAGFDALAAFAGELSTAFEKMRGRAPVPRRLIHLALAGRDQMRSMIEATIEDSLVAEAAAEIAASLRRTTSALQPPVAAKSTPSGLFSSPVIISLFAR